MARMPALPEGSVTFLFTDIEGSTALLHELGDGYADVLAQHRSVLREAVERRGGVVFGSEGDALFCAFPDARDAVAAAGDTQRALDALPDRVRMGIHTGRPALSDGDYVGLDVHRVARITATGHGGQVVVSQATRSLVEGAECRDLGEHRLKDLPEAEWLLQLGDADFPPLRSLSNTNLPVPPTPLVGRARELGELAALRDAVGVPWGSQYDRERIERELDSMRAALGDERFEAASEDGRAVDAERAAEEALAAAG
jgi:class 3 adenylate cyclase